MESPVFTGSFDDVQEEFRRQLWTDGLPIVPPTIERIERFLERTARDPDESLGVLLPANVDATVWSIAVNAVMAGCRPEYMPVLIGIVDAIADPQFRIQDAGSTPGWEPLVIVSGPIVGELDFNCGTGALRVGPQPNTTIGRFLKLYLRNVAGLKGPPGATDKGTFGQSFFVTLAENHQAVRAIGWPPFNVDVGFAVDDSVVTVQSVVAASMPTYSAGERWESHAELIAEVIGQGCWAYWSWVGMWFGRFHPLLVMTPNVAEKIAGDGASKDDIRRFLGRGVHLRARQLERYAWDVGITEFRLDRLVEQGRLPAEYAASSDPERLLPALLDPESVGIVVSGDPDRNQSKGFVQNHLQGPPTSRRIA
ncbi:hypothetical protein [Actinophytocola sp.]|uniref:hypothetical protein n=1 Tax=Actinophytocola sp. TaxID=1872138 RepID=UPI003D6BAE97